MGGGLNCRLTTGVPRPISDIMKVAPRLVFAATLGFVAFALARAVAQDVSSDPASEAPPSVTDMPPPTVVKGDRKSTRLNSSHSQQSRMPSSA